MLGCCRTGAAELRVKCSMHQAVIKRRTLAATIAVLFVCFPVDARRIQQARSSGARSLVQVLLSKPADEVVNSLLTLP